MDLPVLFLTVDSYFDKNPTYSNTQTSCALSVLWSQLASWWAKPWLTQCIKAIASCCLRPKRLNSYREESWTSESISWKCACYVHDSVEGMPLYETSFSWRVNPPGKQLHLKPLDRSTHTEPCWQRPSTQWFIGVSQCVPVLPWWHTHL